MKYISTTFILGAILFVTAFTTTVAASEKVVVIVHKDNANVVDKRLIVKIYTGAAKSWPDGTPVFALDQANNSSARSEFYASVVGKSKVTMRAIWAQNIFSGRGLPPKLANLDEEMKELVSNNKNAIGYILSSSADDRIKVINP